MILYRFLNGSNLSDCIKQLLSGDNVRCAVAFWGKDSDTLLKKNLRAPNRIVCDVSQGGTSPHALRALGAPNNENVRYLGNLHAKVYISDRGAIVASANMSRNGVGLDESPNLIEAGVLITHDEIAYSEISSWFESQWEISKQVDAAALDLAAKRFRPLQAMLRPVRPGSLLDLLAAEPAQFEDVSIVLTQSQSSDVDRERVRATVKKNNPADSKAVDALPAEGMFIGWTRKDLLRWRRPFIEFWMPKKRLSVFGREVVYFCNSEGGLMSRRSWAAVRQVVNVPLPKPAEISATDGPMIRRLLDKTGGGIFNARELTEEIDRLPSL